MWLWNLLCRGRIEYNEFSLQTKVIFYEIQMSWQINKVIPILIMEPELLTS